MKTISVISGSRKGHAGRQGENGFDGTEVKLGSKGSSTQVFRNWKPHFFGGANPLLSDEFHRANGEAETGSIWSKFSDDQLETLLQVRGKVLPTAKEIRAVLDRRKSVPEPEHPEFDFEGLGRGYFAWLRGFVEPFCALRGIGRTEDIPVRITLAELRRVNAARSPGDSGEDPERDGWKPGKAIPPWLRARGTGSDRHLTVGELGSGVPQKFGSPKISPLLETRTPPGDDRRLDTFPGQPALSRLELGRIDRSSTGSWRSPTSAAKYDGLRDGG